MSAGALRDRYPGEYNSWKNMKSRCKAGLGVLHPDFVVFRSFLAAVGPKPSKAHSLDRRDNADRLYGPGLVRWADATTQANNRSSTVVVAVSGMKVPITEVAEQLGVKSDTLRKRRRRGWSDEDMIAAASQTFKGNAQQWPGPQDPARIAAFEHHYLTRPITLEGETRADFYIRQTRGEIGLRQGLIASDQGMLDYLISGQPAAGETSADMEWRWEKEFNSIDPKALKAAIAAHRAYIEMAEARIIEAMALRSTSKWTRPRSL
jgi:hypothetical protein